MGLKGGGTCLGQDHIQETLPTWQASRGEGAVATGATLADS